MCRRLSSSCLRRPSRLDVIDRPQRYCMLDNRGRHGLMSSRFVVPLKFNVGSSSIPSVTGGLRNLLAAPIGVHGEAEIPGKVFLRHFAHVEGSVHLGRPTGLLHG